MVTAPPSIADDAFTRLFLTNGAVADPYPLYELLREQGPVHRLAGGRWMVTGFRESREVLKDPRFGNDVEAAGRARAGAGWRRHPALVMLSRMLLLADSPRHERLYRLVGPAFTAGRVRALQPAIQATTDALVADLVRQGEVDFVPAFADRLPLATIHRVLGISGGEQAELRRQTLEFNAVFERGMDAAQLAAADRAVDEVAAYLRELLAFRRARPGDDLVSTLGAIAAAGGVDEAELVPLLFQVYNASYQTTMSLLGNGLQLLLTHPDQLARLRAAPALVERAVDELARFDPPVQSTGRHARGDLEFAGARIAEGELVVLGLAAANRDPRRYTAPGRLDVSRPGPPALSFGHGPHYCLGAALATAQVRTAIRALAGSRIQIEPAGAPRRLPSSNMRGFASLPITVTQR